MDIRFLGKMSPGLFENVRNRTEKCPELPKRFTPSIRAGKCQMDGASSFRELLPNCHTLLPDMDSCHTHSYIFSPGHCFRFFLSSLWTCSERIDRTLPKAQQTQESSACARVIAQTSQELVKVLHTMAKLWKAVAKSLSSCCKAVSCHCPDVSTPKSSTATMSTNFVLASSTASVKSIKSQLKESVN